MTTFLQAVKLLYYYDDNPSYWSKVVTTLSEEFYKDSPIADTWSCHKYIKETYGVELYYGHKDRRAMVFDSEQSKLLFALRFPGLE